MKLAMDQARAAVKVGEAPIGAVIFDPASGEVIASAHNRPISLNDPTGHAEILALRAAGEKLGNYRLTGLTLVPPTVPASQVLKRALVLRSYLQSVQSRL